ncbi:hypothetical protein QAD02_007528, partial [Eretmocerus hayati]
VLQAALRTSEQSKEASMKRHILKSFPPVARDYEDFIKLVKEERYRSILNPSKYQQEIESRVIESKNGERVIHTGKHDKNDSSFHRWDIQVSPQYPRLSSNLEYHGAKERLFLMFQVVMSRRTKLAYDAVFNHVNEVYAFTNLKVVISDFEQPLRSSIQEKFPQALSVGCNVHFDRAIYAKLKKLKIDVSEERISDIIKKIIALPFLRPREIHKIFERLKKDMTSSQKAKLKEFLKYFKSFWIDIVTPEGFSVFGLFHRTNNISEQLNSETLRIYGAKPDTNCYTLGVNKIMEKTYKEVKQVQNNALRRSCRYSTSLREDQLRKVWIDLEHRREKGIDIEDILVRISNLKGKNLKLLIDKPNEMRLEMGFALTETPIIGKQDNDPDFDSMIESRSSLRQLQRQKKKQDLLTFRAGLEQARRLEQREDLHDESRSECADSAVDLEGVCDSEVGQVDDENVSDSEDDDGSKAPAAVDSIAPHESSNGIEIEPNEFDVPPQAENSDASRAHSPTNSADVQSFTTGKRSPRASLPMQQSFTTTNDDPPD